MPRKDLEQIVNISIKNRFIFMCSSKCGSSTLKYYLQKKEFHRTVLDIKNVDDKRLSPFLSPYQLPKSVFVDMMNGSDFKKFTFVRNPYDRILANYVYKIVKSKRSHPSRVFRKASGIGFDKEVSFKDFVSFICSQQSKLMDAHWRPISENVLFDQIDFDFIGKVENLFEDIVALGKMLYGKNNYIMKDVFDEKGLPLIIESAGFNPVDDPSKYDTEKERAKIDKNDYFDDEIYALINKRYKKDFENFGYETIVEAPKKEVSSNNPEAENNTTQEINQ